ncbi:MAG: glycoside hydrolase family 28 protein, partial [Flavisolibacter sp.]|nr:glycoside hydrolase family 28 protein [Flavisolibacter sp.]
DAQRGAVIKEAKNIEFHNVRITTKEGSSLIAENVKDLTIDGVKTLKPIAGKPVIDLNNVEDVFVYNCYPVRGTEVFLALKGKQTQQITMKGNNFKYAQKALVKDDAITESIAVD